MVINKCLTCSVPIGGQLTSFKIDFPVPVGGPLMSSFSLEFSFVTVLGSGYRESLNGKLHMLSIKIKFKWPHVMSKTPFSLEMTGWLDSVLSVVSKYGFTAFNKPRQQPESANLYSWTSLANDLGWRWQLRLSFYLMIYWDMMVREAMMRKLPIMFVNCWVRLIQHKQNGTTQTAVLSKRALALNTVRDCGDVDQQGRAGLCACGVRWGRRGRSRSKGQVRGRGHGAHFSVCMRCECHDTLVNCLIFIFLYTVTTPLSFSAVFCLVFLLDTNLKW